MRLFRFVLVYTALAMGANTVAADPALEALREGDMRKLVFHSEPKDVSDAAFLNEAEGDMTLADLKGKYILLNFWATWCAPCREEMPGLNALQNEFSSDSFDVVTIATGRNPPAAINRFFDEIGVDALPKYRDPKQQLGRGMGIFGLPITVILNPEGQEIARLRGDAHWDSDSAKAIIAALTAAKTN